LPEPKLTSKTAYPFYDGLGKDLAIKRITSNYKRYKVQELSRTFLGGGAVFFFLNQFKKAFLNDYNDELIQTYECVKNNVESLIKQLRTFENTEEFYYLTRSSNFNNEIKKAARFIYLNQTSFNGIYRVNLQGQYNVPYGYREKEFLNASNLRIASKKLATANFSNVDFSCCITKVKKGDLVFLDPPYTITHNNNGFFKYNKKIVFRK
jgi:DNA adenine methylase